MKLGLFFITAFLIVGCSAVKTEKSKADIEDSQKPGQDQANERAEKSKALLERMYFQLKTVEVISEDDNYLGLRISYQLNSVTKFTAFYLPVKMGQLVFQDMSSWLSPLEIREQTRVEFVLQRQESNNEKRTVFLGVQLRKPSREREKVSQNLVKLTLLENSSSSLVPIEKQKFEFPAKTEFRKWMNENL